MGMGQTNEKGVLLYVQSRWLASTYWYVLRTARWVCYHDILKTQLHRESYFVVRMIKLEFPVHCSFIPLSIVTVQLRVRMSFQQRGIRQRHRRIRSFGRNLFGCLLIRYWLKSGSGGYVCSLRLRRVRQSRIVIQHSAGGRSRSG